MAEPCTPHRRRMRLAVAVAAAAAVQLPGVAAAESVTPTAPPSTAGTATPAPVVSGPTTTANAAGFAPVAADSQVSQQLIDARAALDSAKATLEAARGQVALARARERAADANAATAQTALATATVRLDQARRSLDTVQQETAALVDLLGQVARRAYQQQGVPSEVTELISPDQARAAAEFGRGSDAVMRAASADLARLEEAQASLVEARDALAAAEATARQAAAAAERLQQEQSAARAQAEAAVGRAEEAVLSQARATAAFEHARTTELQQYRATMSASGDIAAALGASAVTGVGGGAAGTSTPLVGMVTTAFAGTLQRPGDGAVTSPFGMRFHPILHYVKLHTGEDFGVGDGSIRAAAAGVVVSVSQNAAYGNIALVSHGVLDGKSLVTAYGHAASFVVRVGDTVAAGQRIGTIGSTGYSTGPHLHFEVRLAGEPVDPAPFLAPSGGAAVQPAGAPTVGPTLPVAP